MKISKNTLDILKNFSSINESIYIKKGDVLTTVSPYGVIFGEAKVEESFPRDFAIYNLPAVLGGLQSLLSDSADFTFNETHVVITTAENRTMKVMYADPSTVKAFNKKIAMPKNTVKFEVSEKDIADLLKASSVLQVPELSIASDGKSLTLTALDTKNESMGDFSVKTEQALEQEFEVILKFDNLKILAAPYVVEASDQIVKLSHKDGNLRYWVPVESNTGL